MKYSIVGILALTAAVAVEFTSGFWLNIGISITLLAILIGSTSIYSLWPNRKNLGKYDRTILGFCCAATLCGVFNAIVIAVVLFTVGMPQFM